MTSAAELDAEIDALFRRPPAEFTASRNELAKRSGRKEIKAYKKPTLAAWAVNQVVLRHAAAFSEMRSAHEAAASVSASSGDPEALRARLITRKQTLTQGLALARQELDAAGLGCTAATEDKIRATLEAVVADRGLQLGRLSKERVRPGFAVLAPPAADDALRAPARTVRKRAQAELRARREAVDVAGENATRAKTIAQRAAAEVTRLEARLEDARRRAVEATEAKERALRATGEAVMSLNEAQSRVDSLPED